MRIVRITVGVLEAGEPRVYEIEPHPEGLTVVPTGSLPAGAIAAAARHALSRPEPRDSGEIPFVRISLAADDLSLEVADDALQSMRMLTEARDGALPLVMEAAAEDDVELEALLMRISTAAGLEEAEQLGPALAMGIPSAGEEADEEELAYVEEQRRATRLAAAVRQIDDQMTASVVPDWLWIATGFGGLGVFLTAVVFLYPETRIFLIPALILLSVLGFGLYGWRSFQELRVRGRLQIERAELRARREAARSEARERRRRLVERGRDPDALMVRLQGLVIPRSVPAILAKSAAELAELAQIDRQAIAFVDGAIAHERAVSLVAAPG